MTDTASPGSTATARDAESAPAGPTDAELREIYSLPIPELLFRAQTVHREYNDPTKVQLCTLLSIKTGGCPEDCAYCPQSAHHEAEVEREDLLDLETVKAAANEAKASGSTRFCMGAAWREVRDGEEFDRVIEMVRHVRELGMEACCTLGMMTKDQAERLAEAGLTAYNHNLDTGPEFYDRIISTRSYGDRLETIANVRAAGVHVCSGGIIGMGERLEDRIAMLGVLSRLDPPPESVPINALAAVAGTPLERQRPADTFEMVRMIATARIAMPRSRIRLSAGRADMSDESQALCFLAGANSIFAGDRLLTTPNPSETRDTALLAKLGMTPLDDSDSPGATG